MKIYLRMRETFYDKFLALLVGGFDTSCTHTVHLNSGGRTFTVQPPMNLFTFSC